MIALTQSIRWSTEFAIFVNISPWLVLIVIFVAFLIMKWRHSKLPSTSIKYNLLRNSDKALANEIFGFRCDPLESSLIKLPLHFLDTRNDLVFIFIVKRRNSTKPEKIMKSYFQMVSQIGWQPHFRRSSSRSLDMHALIKQEAALRNSTLHDTFN